MNNLGPMVESKQNDARLAFAGPEDVKGLLGSGEEVFRSEEEVVGGYDSEAAGKGERMVVFLGVDLVDEKKQQQPQEGEDVFVWKEFRGAPFFAVDVTPREGDGEEGKAKAEELIKKMEEEKGHAFLSASARGMALEAGHGEFDPMVLF